MDFIAELVGEIAEAVLEFFMYDSKVPKPIRMLVTTLFFGIAASAVIICAVLVEAAAAKIIFILLAVFFIFGYIKVSKK